MSVVPGGEEDKRRRLPWSLAHYAFNAVFSQCTYFGPVFPLFLAELGLAKNRIGVLFSLLPFSGLLALVVARRAAAFGLKRTYALCWAARTTATALLLLVPWAASHWSSPALFAYIGVVVALFALCRAVGETAFFPWFQEVVPPAIRGQFTALSNITETSASCAALVVAGYVLGQGGGLERFSLLIGGGVVFGYLSVACLWPTPAETLGRGSREALWPGMRAALADRDFRLLLGGVALVTVNIQQGAFVPLFLREQAGFDERQIVLLQTSYFAGIILSSYGWGWLADRRGPGPVMRAGLGLMALAPLGWALLPYHHPWSYAMALGVVFVGGVAMVSWYVVVGQLLFVQVVPPDRRIEYMAVFYAWTGLVGGCSPLLAGQLLEHYRDFHLQWGVLHLNAYTLLFLGGGALATGSLGLLHQIRLQASPVAPGARQGRQNTREIG